jgi:transposase
MVTTAQPVYSAWLLTRGEAMETTRHIGVDLHRNCFTACIRLENGRNYLSEWKIEHLSRLVGKLRPGDEVAVEVTGNTRLFHDAVAPHVKRVVAVNASQFKVITHSVKKTDPHDARNLALYLAKDLLPEVRMKDKTRAQIASLTQTRDTLVKLRTALKNKINNIVSAHGINLNKESLASEKGLEAVMGMRFDPLVEIELKILVEQIRSLNKSIASVEEIIKRESQKLEGHKNLTSIKGIGGLSAGILLSIIGDIRDFADEGKLAAYFGIVPRINNSNETEHSGRITKRGTKLGRTTLVQCALIAQRYSPYLKKYYERKKSRGTGKAIIALARKLLGIIYRTLKNKWVFADFPNFVLAE